jgi:serine/threonine protein kinase
MVVKGNHRRVAEILLLERVNISKINFKKLFAALQEWCKDIVKYLEMNSADDDWTFSPFSKVCIKDTYVFKLVDKSFKGSKLYLDTNIFPHNAEIVTSFNAKSSILKYDYIHGKHVASNPMQFSSILWQIQEIHKKEFVHGDIRLANIIFTPDYYESILIDFDNSALHGKDLYRAGLQKVPDGGRAPNQVERMVMMKDHDWFGIITVMELHRTSDDENHGKRWQLCIDKVKRGHINKAIHELRKCGDISLCLKDQLLHDKLKLFTV